MADYLLPDGMTLVAAGRELADHLEVQGGRRTESDRTYYDTFDGLLHADGLVAVWERGQLTLAELDGDRVRARLALGKPGPRLFARDLPPGRMRDELAALIDVRALLPLARIRLRERPYDVLDSERKTTVRMLLEQPAVGRRRLGTRVRVAAVRGYDKALRRVSETLQSELGLQPAAQSLVDEAVMVSGGRPGGTSSRIDVPLTRGQTADSAAVSVLRALLEVIEANLEGTIEDIDSEFLHDFRVSVRRSRAVQRELRRVFPPAELEHYRTGFRRLQQVTGDSRDLDVYVLEFGAMRELAPEPLRPDLDSLFEVLAKHRAAAHRRMVRALRAERTSSLLSGWSTFLDGLERLPLADRPDAARPIDAVAGERILKVYGRMVRMGDAIDEFSPPTDYHELRKKGKELRYLLELFGAPLFPDEIVRPMIRSLKALQDVLGRHQDREIQVETLRSLGPEVSASPRGAEGLMAMGVLVERLDEDQRAARAEFAERFAAFASPEQRKLVKRTFG